MTNPELASRLEAAPAERRLESYRLVRDLCAAVLVDGYEPTPGLLLGAARVRPWAAEADLANVPAAGSTLVALGAPYGTLEALAVSTALEEVRPDVKVAADPFLSTAPNLRPSYIAYDPWERTRANVRAVRRGVEWMQSGGLLAAFAGGEGWPSVVRAARAAHAVVIPAVAVWRRTPVPEGGTIEVRFGAPLPQERLSGFAADRDAGHYLRWRTNLVAWRHEAPVRLVPRLAR